MDNKNKEFAKLLKQLTEDEKRSILCLIKSLLSGRE